MSVKYTRVEWDERAQDFVPRPEPYNHPGPVPLGQVRNPLPQWQVGTEAFRRRQQITGKP